MPARTLISVEEYLRTSYRPDCDYVDGEVVGRNMGEWDHSRLQGKLLVYLARYEKAGCIAVPEQRVQVGAARFRIPDICLVLGEPGEKILTKPPFLCIEVLSPEDRLSRVMVRVKEYLTMGVPYIWVFDPETKRAYDASAGDLREVGDLLATGDPRIEIRLAEVFA